MNTISKGTSFNMQVEFQTGIFDICMNIWPKEGKDGADQNKDVRKTNMGNFNA